MSVSCKFNGRLGNILFNMCQVVGHCKRYNLQWYFPTYAWACTNNIVPVSVPNTGTAPVNPTVYHEPMQLKSATESNPYYHEIPFMDNVEFNGYYQSFKYFDFCRQDILDLLNFPHHIEQDVTSIHIRRGDCIPQPDTFPMAPHSYYHNATEYMIERGFTHFRVFSDDIPWCREEFIPDRYPGGTFEFRESYSDVEDFIAMSCCANNITARSTFSLLASWFNLNPDKIVLVPDGTFWWYGQNLDLLTGTENWLTQISL